MRAAAHLGEMAEAAMAVEPADHEMLPPPIIEIGGKERQQNRSLRGIGMGERLTRADGSVEHGLSVEFVCARLPPNPLRHGTKMAQPLRSPWNRA